MFEPKPTTHEDALNKCKAAISEAGNKTRLYLFVGLSNISEVLNPSLTPMGWRAFYDGVGYYTLEKV